MSWLDKILSGHGKKAEQAKEQAVVDYTSKLKGLVYDDEIVKELAPIFAALHGTSGFDKVVELLETKEQQIATISGGEWFKQESDSDQSSKKEETSDANGQDTKVPLSAEEILELKYKDTK